MQHKGNTKMCLCQQQARIRDTRTTRSESKQSPARKDGIEMNEEQVPQTDNFKAFSRTFLPGECRNLVGYVVILPFSFEVSRGKSGKVGLLVDLYYFLRGAFPRDYKQHVRVRNSQE